MSSRNGSWRKGPQIPFRELMSGYSGHSAKLEGTQRDAWGCWAEASVEFTMHAAGRHNWSGYVKLGLVACFSTFCPASSHAERTHVDSRPSGAPLMAIVALREQRVTIYGADGKISEAPVSTGQTGYETPAGIYSVIQKEAEHYSNLYDDASMPFMQRITWSGIALHAGPLPGYAASHGCIRMPHPFAERLFGLTKIGMRVLVVPRDVGPSDIVHPALFKPTPSGVLVSLTPPPADNEQMRLGAAQPETSVPPTIPSKRLEILKAAAAAKWAEAEAARKIAQAAKTAAARAAAEAAGPLRAQRSAEISKQRADALLKRAELALASSRSPAASERGQNAKAKALAKVAELTMKLDAIKADAQPKEEAAARAREAAKTADAAQVAALAAAKEATARMSPVSVLISRQTQRLYVRQAFQPMYETAVTIRDPDKPIGTHIFTAVGYANDGADVHWSVVSMTRGQEEMARRGQRARARSGDRHGEAEPTDVGQAKAALDRVTIPQEAIARISDVLSPGSSLILSDEGISKETGKGTDFVVLMSGEPEGGITIRSRQAERTSRRDPESRLPHYEPAYKRSLPWSPFNSHSYSPW
jgi:L,D-transpeptidase-like protein